MRGEAFESRGEGTMSIWRPSLRETTRFRYFPCQQKSEYRSTRHRTVARTRGRRCTNSPIVGHRTRPLRRDQFLRAASQLADLYFWRHLWIHQRCAAVGVNHLSRNPPCFFRTKERNDVTDIFRRSQAPGWRPTAGMPISNELLHLVRQCVQHAILRPSGADGIYCDATFGQGYGEISDERFQRSLR